jgi:hypothetical protein
LSTGEVFDFYQQFRAAHAHLRVLAARAPTSTVDRQLSSQAAVYPNPASKAVFVKLPLPCGRRPKPPN